ncbi:MAG: hypothetical protein EAY75_12060 [Bacteroidetes bacterium]|nr:MAG: hypothetical protein EAY75_12060 [Bacteroidota bacterium]
MNGLSRLTKQKLLLIHPAIAKTIQALGFKTAPKSKLKQNPHKTPHHLQPCCAYPKQQPTAEFGFEVVSHSHHQNTSL